MHDISSVIRQLEALDREGNRRRLTELASSQKYIYYQNKQYLNLSSNDYLGLSDPQLQRRFFNDISGENIFLMSNPSSRLMTGNSPHYTALEECIARLFGKEAALVLGSGFLVNSGLLPALASPDDLILADKLVHASLIDGLRLSPCRWLRFRHNDLRHLRTLLEKEPCKGTVYVVTESIFSMDGDTAPLRELAALKEEFGFRLYVDEAHAFGVRGAKGCGLAEETGTLGTVDLLVATLGKAAASQGAFVVCSEPERELLVNRMRPLIFSTALPPISLMWSRFVLDRFPDCTDRRAHLKKLSTKFYTLMNNCVDNPEACSHIFPLIVSENQATLELAERLKEAGFWVTAIRHPTVPKGSARLRISLNAGLDESDIDRFAEAVTRFRPPVDNFKPEF